MRVQIHRPLCDLARPAHIHRPLGLAQQLQRKPLQKVRKPLEREFVQQDQCATRPQHSGCLGNGLPHPLLAETDLDILQPQEATERIETALPEGQASGVTAYQAGSHARLR